MVWRVGLVVCYITIWVSVYFVGFGVGLATVLLVLLSYFVVGIIWRSTHLR